jgi:hypothetical protein
MLGGWGLVGFIILLGPTAIQTVEKGPFWDVSGYWCWIAPTYTVEQFTMEYLFVSLMTSALFILRLRLTPSMSRC